MPHKRNPVTLRTDVPVMAAVVAGRSNYDGAYENVALWHERDISHSSVERIILPDSTILWTTLLAKMTAIVSQMRVFPQRMLRNLESTHGLVFSGHCWQDWWEKGIARDDAYKSRQENAMAGGNRRPASRRQPWRVTRVITKYPDPDPNWSIPSTCSAKLRYVDNLFEPVFGAHPAGEKGIANKA